MRRELNRPSAVLGALALFSAWLWPPNVAIGGEGQQPAPAPTGTLSGTIAKLVDAGGRLAGIVKSLTLKVSEGSQGYEGLVGKEVELKPPTVGCEVIGCPIPGHFLPDPKIGSALARCHVGDQLQVSFKEEKGAYLITTFKAPEGFQPPAAFRLADYKLRETSAVEGSTVEFSLAAKNAAGKPLTYTAAGVPSWAKFNAAARIFWGTAPRWDKNPEVRKAQQGTFDVCFKASDGGQTLVTISVLDAGWKAQTVAELLSDKKIGTPVELRNIREETIKSKFGGGKEVRKVTFDFTSQVVNLPGYEDDWEHKDALAYLPVEKPAAPNAGAVGTGNRQEFGERACAELGLPVLIFGPFADGENTQTKFEKYVKKASETRNPRHTIFVQSAAMFARGTDALVTLMKKLTQWPASYQDFKVVYTGGSKFGYTSWVAAAGDRRTVGIVPGAFENGDHDAYRLLQREEGRALPWRCPASEGAGDYAGIMSRFFLEPVTIQGQLPNCRALLTGGTADRAVHPKFAITEFEKNLKVPHRVCYVPNLGHSMDGERHSACWLMWLAHCFLGRPVSAIDALRHRSEGDGFVVEAQVSGKPSVQEVAAWATEAGDTDWKRWKSYPMQPGEKGLYRGQIPADSQAYLVEVRDTADGVKGVITSTPQRVK